MGRAVPAVGADDVKTSWPEVVGRSPLAALLKIHGDRPDVQIEFHPVGESVPPGYDDKRVRVFLNNDAGRTVAQTPVVG